MKLKYTYPVLICLILLNIVSCKKRNREDEAQSSNNKIVKELHLGDSVKVNFPDGSINSLDISLKIVKDEEREALFNEMAWLFDVEHYWPYTIVLDLGKNQALDDNISMEVKISDRFKKLKKTTSGFEVFAQIYQDNANETLDNFQIIPSKYNPETGTILLEMPRYLFTDKRSKNKTFEAIIMIGISPGENPAFSVLQKNAKALTASAATSKTSLMDCEASPISCPLGLLDKCSELLAQADADDLFGVRVHPVLKYKKQHNGIDFKVKEGTPIYAVRSGKIKVSQFSNTAGNFIEIMHDNGNKSRYLHLSELLVKPGQDVLAGQLIGVSGKTGRVTGAHLHFEFYTNSSLNNKKGPVDPFPCLQEQNAAGSITVRDNGNWADDAFEVFLDGVSIGKTDIGAANSIAMNNLRPGKKSLTLKCVIAPDNEGTYEIILDDGLKFSDGSERKSGILQQSKSITWEIIIPTVIKTKSNISLMKRNDVKEGR
ncbi:M23 family metallopeptidase [Pedobacter sp. MR2016-19]|uniref:M23 family metallopeptidase n=1 Tax=Pedobacter sp. MR2016-19 TaxID=2780089 RepID=UPI0018760FBE|nr:M23 family metallopeptidase [Pedobacter sp. MR2016-19]MBE5320117.1 M23 family metallopeptidase [Pedobacter sp. MR2016-19]